MTLDFVLMLLSERLALHVLGMIIPKLKAKTHEIEEKARGDDPNSGNSQAKELYGCRFVADLTTWRLGGLLNICVAHGLLSCIRFLINAGADPNWDYHYESRTWPSFQDYIGPPLVLARYFPIDPVTMVKFLIKMGASLDETTGRPLLCFAAENGLLRLAMYLLKKGVPADEGYPANTHSPLELACYKGHVAMERFLRVVIMLSSKKDVPTDEGRLDLTRPLASPTGSIAKLLSRMLKHCSF